MRIYLKLFWAFFKIGMFTFGGGYAMIPLIEDKCVEKEKWITHEEMMNLIIIAESTPGPVAINCSTFVGYRQKKFVGAIISTLGMVLPSLILIYLISMFLDHFLEIEIIASAFKGIKIAVGILIIDAAIKMAKKLPKKVLSYILLAAFFAVMMLINFFSWNFSTISLMLIAGALGLIIFFIETKLKKKGGEEK